MPSEEEIAAQKAADEKAKADADAKAKADADAAEAAKKAAEVKAGEALTPDAEARAKAEAALVEIKKQNKELAKSVKDLEKKILDGGSTEKEISGDLKDIYDAYPDVDKKFIDLILAKAKAAATAEVKPLTDAQKNQEIDTKFAKNFKIAMEKLGKDYDGIVNENTIKALTLLPANANKTFSEIIEETYGGALTGKRTIDTTAPGGGKDPAPLDFTKARKDPTYFDEVMKDPKLKAEYNAKMLLEGF